MPACAGFFFMPSTIPYLYSLQRFGMKFGLRNIRSLLRSIGDPQKQFPAIHIAGTNGKGSTSAMIAAIYSAAGFRVGLYTSPHLVRFNERIRINGIEIADKDIVRIVRNLRPEIETTRATFFEATTAVAFQYFAERHVDIAVIETGLGGRLDSTNVIRPLVSVITSIGKDHIEQLGKTFSSIAAEKAGIIKSSVPVVVGNVRGTALATIRKIAASKRSPLLLSRKIIIPRNVTLQLQGLFQSENARCAIAAIALTSDRFLIGDAAVKIGLEKTTELTGLHARCETIQHSPAIILDVAHNPDGMRALVRQLKTISIRKLFVVFGVMKDKDYTSMLKEFRGLKPTIICTQPFTERALPVQKLIEVCRVLNFQTLSAATVGDAVESAKKTAGKSGTIVVTGSHYVVGEAMPHCRVQKKP
jgi:dihydrofolate synthase/folylpolyglutamate synthase